VLIFLIVLPLCSTGKTRLVESAFESVHVANGFVIRRKFESSKSPLAVVLSLFDGLCNSIVERDANFAQYLYQQLVSEFGAHFHLLARTVPGVLRMAPPSCREASLLVVDAFNEGEVNYFSLCDNMKRFIRVVSSSSCPLFLFLDDLQVSEKLLRAFYSH
jgi:hypothetical protein